MNTNKERPERQELTGRAVEVILDFGDAIRLQTLPNWVNANLTISQVKAVALLAHHGALAVGELAELLDIGSPAASIVVQQLVEQDLAQRTEDSRDRRRTLVSLTEAGKRLKSGQRQLREAKLRQWLDRLDDDALANLLHGLGALYEVAHAEGALEERV
jgi:DNA-binding MarR family transcriptional regulator